jgi:SAM-dependent methyltransferase
VSSITPYQFNNEDTEGQIIRPLLPKLGKLYELECGGQLTTPDAIGVDMITNGEFIDTIQTKSVATIKADVSQKLPFIDADIIIARHILEHMVDPIGALEHWKEALLPNGLLVIAVPDEAKMKSIIMNKEHKHAYTKEFAIRLLSLVGFHNIHVYDSKNNVSFIITGEKI